MRILFDPTSIPEIQKSVVTIGNFDGVHRGHISLIHKVIERAHTHKAVSVAITFEPHTRLVLGNEPMALLTTFKEKCLLLEHTGLDYLICISFSKAFASKTHEEFLSDTLLGTLKACEIVVGSNHSFGKNKSGDENFLQNAMSRMHFNLFVADLESSFGALVSSTTIRQAIITGDMAHAIELLSHPYLLIAERIAGLGIARTMGFPTVNFAYPPAVKVLPPPGVYAAELLFKGTVQFGAFYMGDCPTFEGRTAHGEFHSLQYKEPLPNVSEEGCIVMHSFIRPDEKFDNPALLTAQIAKDITSITTFFSQEKKNADQQRA